MDMSKVLLEYTGFQMLGVDQCLVGFLHCHQVKHLNKLEGALCQVMEVYSENSESPTRQTQEELWLCNCSYCVK